MLCQGEVLNIPVVSVGSVTVFPSRLRFVFGFLETVPGVFGPGVFSVAAEVAVPEVRWISVFNHFLVE